MANQLLTHLTSKFSKQHELVATEGLTFILEQSESARRAFTRFIQTLGVDVDDVVSYRSEVAGELLERPDIVGFAADGSQALIMEGKFDAGLTDNQPNTYLRRLRHSGESALVFVVPEYRLDALWKEVVSRARGSEQAEVPSGRDAFSMTMRNGQIMAMVSWTALLRMMIEEGVRKTDPVVNDLLQLEEYCAWVEGEAFRPFTGEELSSLHLPKRNRDFCNLVDAVIDGLRNDGHIHLKGVRATPQREAYVRYFSFLTEDLPSDAGFKVDYALWMRHEVSPVWIFSQRKASAFFRPIFEAISLRDSHFVNGGAKTNQLAAQKFATCNAMI